MPAGKYDSDLSIRGGGILCVGCVEKRLGRRLTVADFAPLPLDLIKQCQSTPRLLSRLGIAFMAVANEPLPEHIVKRWLEATLLNALPREMRKCPPARDAHQERGSERRSGRSRRQKGSEALPSRARGESPCRCVARGSRSRPTRWGN